MPCCPRVKIVPVPVRPGRVQGGRAPRKVLKLQGGWCQGPGKRELRPHGGGSAPSLRKAGPEPSCED